MIDPALPPPGTALGTKGGHSRGGKNSSSTLLFSLWALQIKLTIDKLTGGKTQSLFMCVTLTHMGILRDEELSRVVRIWGLYTSLIGEGERGKNKLFF